MSSGRTARNGAGRGGPGRRILDDSAGQEQGRSPNPPAHRREPLRARRAAAIAGTVGIPKSPGTRSTHWQRTADARPRSGEGEPPVCTLRPAPHGGNPMGRGWDRHRHHRVLVGARELAERPEVRTPVTGAPERAGGEVRADEGGQASRRKGAPTVIHDGSHY